MTPDQILDTTRNTAKDVFKGQCSSAFEAIEFTIEEAKANFREAAQAQAAVGPVKDLNDLLVGKLVSMDVSTGEHDAYHRVFGTVCEVMLQSCGAAEDTILAIEDSRNFQVAVEPVDRLPMKAADEFELRRLLEEEKYTVRQLTRALRDATEGPTFMGEPVLQTKHAAAAPGDIRALKHRIHELEGEVIGYKRILDRPQEGEKT